MIKGLSMPYFAKYAYDPETDTVAYSDGGRVGKAVEYSIAVRKSEDNHAYADNGIAETDKGKFLDGTVSLQTSNLSQELSKTLFGVSQKTINVGTGEDTEEVTVLVYTDGDTSPDVGFGIIEWHQVDNVDSWRAIVLQRSYFAVPGDAATTKGETVTWQQRTIEGTILRSEKAESSGHFPWKMEAWLESEAKAEAFLRHVLNISE